MLIDTDDPNMASPGEVLNADVLKVFNGEVF